MLHAISPEKKSRSRCPCRKEILGYEEIPLQNNTHRLQQIYIHEVQRIHCLLMLSKLFAQL